MKSLGSLSVNAIRLEQDESCQLRTGKDILIENKTYSIDASDTGILLRLRSSCSL